MACKLFTKSSPASSPARLIQPWKSTARKILTDRETSIPGPKRATIHFRVDVAGFHGNPVVQRLRLEPQRCEKWTDGDKELKMYFVEPGTIIVDGILPISKESGQFNAPILGDQLISRFTDI